MKIAKKAVAAILVATMLMSASVFCTNAASAQYYKKLKSSYEVYTISTSNAKEYSKKVNTPGFKKTKHTSGSITVSKSQSFTVSASSSVSATFNAGFAKVSAQVSVGASTTATVSAGTTIHLDKSAPNGVYYAYINVPRKKVDFKVQGCTLNHTGWYTKYTKTIATVPMLNRDYLELRK